MLFRGLLITAVLLVPLGARGQVRPVRWQRTSDATEIPKRCYKANGSSRSLTDFFHRSQTDTARCGAWMDR